MFDLLVLKQIKGDIVKSVYHYEICNKFIKMILCNVLLSCIIND